MKYYRSEVKGGKNKKKWIHGRNKELKKYTDSE